MSKMMFVFVMFALLVAQVFLVRQNNVEAYTGVDTYTFTKCVDGYKYVMTSRGGITQMMKREGAKTVPIECEIR